MKLVNAGSAEQPLAITLNGLGTAARTAHLETLQANTTWATNTIAHPDRIVPVRLDLAVQGEQIQHVMPGYSIQVLEISLK